MTNSESALSAINATISRNPTSRGADREELLEVVEAAVEAAVEECGDDSQHAREVFTDCATARVFGWTSVATARADARLATYLD